MITSSTRYSHPLLKGIKMFMEALACAVIHQAWKDRRYYLDTTEQFFQMENEDFIFWCNVADIDPRAIITQITSNKVLPRYPYDQTHKTPSNSSRCL